ncbi:LysM peptidoglycan-binding domain-containing protein [Akkermansiaceae bacterium]|nr:LysM peptidoglycan-binding domain-containing protein [Akkermansiaceae bacterium]
MKYDRLPTRRGPVRKTLYARLFNKAKPKRQRAAAATADADDMEEGGVNFSRSLSIIFAIHIVAIGMIFFHKQYLSKRTDAPEASTKAEPAKPAAAAAVAMPPVAEGARPTLSNGDNTYMVKKGDNYPLIAAKHGVDESELRNMNRSAVIQPGVVLRIPQRKRIVAEDPPEVAALRNPSVPASDQGLVEILPPPDAAQAQLIRPATLRTEDAPRAVPVTSARTHTVKSGENIWRISNHYKISQKEILSLNGITDPSKLQIGQVLKLP